MPAVNIKTTKSLYFPSFLLVCVFLTLIVGMRGIDVGTDTTSYAQFFRSSVDGPVAYIEPGFAWLTYILRKLNFSLIAYQSVLFVLLLATVIVSTKKYYYFIGSSANYSKFLCISLTLLLLSPIFEGASINIIRQGLSALLTFTALLCFTSREWRQFIIYGLIASSLHYSAFIILVFAPALLFSSRVLWVVLLLGLVCYLSGLSQFIVALVFPEAYTFVADYGRGNAVGINIASPLFSSFLVVCSYVATRAVVSSQIQRIRRSGLILIVMLLPYFFLGWADYAYRYRVIAWISASLIAAAIIFSSRIKPLRSPLVVIGSLFCSAIVFYSYIFVFGMASG